jgi:hypothetical protein
MSRHIWMALAVAVLGAIVLASPLSAVAVARPCPAGTERDPIQGKRIPIDPD